MSMPDLLAELTDALDRHCPCVYCAVVDTRGSTPQKAGAAMLVFPNGSQQGTLGGGCVEAEVKQRALHLLASNPHGPELLSFCLDDNYGWDDGLICGGRMTILADPLAVERHTVAAHYYRCLRHLTEAGHGCTQAVVVDDAKAGLPVASRYLFDAAQQLTTHLGPPMNERIANHLQPVRQRPRPALHHGVAYLPVLPRVTLLIVGGGHVGQAVARLASDLHFDICVLDDREAYANRERFPSAKRLVVGDIGAALKEMIPNDIDASTFCLIVTRGHAHDEEALYHLVRSAAGYVGMIGSKRKIKLIYDDLIARGIEPSLLAKVYAPLGFAIGSQTVPEIAVSIVAELIACRNLGHTIPEARVRVPILAVARD
jgi:xanthine dehydrogenase accessory factor